VLREHGFEVVQVPCGSRPERPAVVIAEADCAVELVRAVPELGTRGSRPLVVAVTRWWNENETELRRVADAVLHAPLRQAEFAPVLAQLTAALRSDVHATPRRSLPLGTR
jgi:riboflavin biosynthesis pyrimidine reductase